MSVESHGYTILEIQQPRGRGPCLCRLALNLDGVPRKKWYFALPFTLISAPSSVCRVACALCASACCLALLLSPLALAHSLGLVTARRLSSGHKLTKGRAAQHPPDRGLLRGELGAGHRRPVRDCSLAASLVCYHPFSDSTSPGGVPVHAKTITRLRTPISMLLRPISMLLTIEHRGRPQGGKGRPRARPFHVCLHVLRRGCRGRPVVEVSATSQ